MSNGFAVPLFYLIAAAVFVFVRITTSRERRSMMTWIVIGIVCFGTIGFVYESVSTGHLPVGEAPVSR